MKSREELELMAYHIRKDAFKMAFNSGKKGAHIGGSMSVVEILSVLYASIMKYDVNNPGWNNRDRFIMSKAHGAIALYAALKNVGILSEEEINGAMHGDSPYYEHPKMNINKGIEFSGGSLGQGLSLGVGTAIALRRLKNNEASIYILLGDGECDEGSVWEAAAAVTHFNLKQITIIIDKNELQYDGETKQIMSLGNFYDRWVSMGFDVIETDGHDVMALQDSFYKKTENPKVVIANTIKGKGVSFAENQVDWHTGYFTKELYEQAMRELEQCRK